MSDRAPRKYQEIWRLIKAREVAKVQCHRLAVKSVKKGVIMEKWKDDGFKILNEIEKPFIDIIVTPVPNHDTDVIIEFKLRTKFGIVEIQS